MIDWKRRALLMAEQAKRWRNLGKHIMDDSVERIYRICKLEVKVDDLTKENARLRRLLKLVERDERLMQDGDL